jgi:hypothetical protein
MFRRHLIAWAIAALLLSLSIARAADDYTPSDDDPSLAESPLPDDEPLAPARPVKKQLPETILPESTASESAVPELLPAQKPPAQRPVQSSIKPLGKSAPLAKTESISLDTTVPDEVLMSDNFQDDVTLSSYAEPVDKPGAAPRGYVIGDSYTLKVSRGDAVMTVGGNLLKATDQWIVLRRIAAGRNDYGIPLLSSLPKLGKVFSRSYETLVEDELWIPREAATIEAHRKVSTTAPGGNTVGKSPPLKTRCGVALAQGDKVARRDGELSAVGEDSLTLLMYTPFRSPYRQQLTRSDVLCISLPVVLSNVRMTQRDSEAQNNR